MNQENELGPETPASRGNQSNPKGKSPLKRTLKFLMWFLLGAVALVLLLLVTSPFWAGPATASISNKLAPEYTGTKFNLDGASFNVFSGNHEIGKLCLGNPEGFSATDAVSVASVAVGLSTMSLLSDTIHISDITVDSPYVSYLDENETNNFAVIAASVAKKVGPKEKKEEKPGQKLALDKLKVSNVKMRIVSKGVGGEPFELTVKDVSMEGFFQDDKDISIKRLAVTDILVKFEKSYWGVVSVRIPSVELDALVVKGSKKGPDGKKTEGSTTIDHLKLASIGVKLLDVGVAGVKLVGTPEIPIGDITIDNYGKEEKKSSLVDLIKDLWDAILKKAKSIGGSIGDGAKSIGEGAKGAVEGAKDAVEGALKKVPNPFAK